MIKVIDCEECFEEGWLEFEFEATETYTDGTYAEYEAECPDHGALFLSVTFADCHGE